MSKQTNQFPYYSVQEFTTTLLDQNITVRSKPGIPAWSQVTPATALLAAQVQLLPGQKILQIGSGHGALAVALARQLGGAPLFVLEDNILAVGLSRETLRVNEITNVHLHGGPSWSGAAVSLASGELDLAILNLPKGRKLARKRLVEAFDLLKEGGVFYLAGANQEGIQTVIKDAEALFGRQAAIPAYKKGNRVARLVKTGTAAELPNWASEPGIAPNTWYEFLVQLDQLHIPIRSLPGVFSYEGLDEGTRLLLEQMESVKDQKVLDFGCGSGIIGLALAQRGAKAVDLIDINLLAVAAAQENLRSQAVPNARAFPSDVLEAVSDQKYDLIASNPPFHTGRDVDYEVASTFIAHAAQLLNPEGQLVLVANRFIRYDRLLHNYFTHVNTLAETGKFHVLAARR